ncbi:flagellar biosynthesis protein [Roseovarius indicus]|uniref:flagellar biosynthesis protein n=1 Tax=Roseovarius indicus TaxID=540747 RepID=UPI0032ECCB86
MTLSALLEDFSEPQPGTTVALTDVMIEEEKLQAFEKGYQAGWDDSAKAQKDSAVHLSEEFASNIRDLSFTYQEAYAGVVGAMEPLIRQIVTSVLPVLAQDTLGARVTELLKNEIDANGPQPVTIVTAPGQATALEAILPEETGLSFEIREDTSLAESQVQLRLGDVAEREIDLAEVLAGIATAVEAFFQQASQTLKERA